MGRLAVGQKIMHEPIPALEDTEIEFDVSDFQKDSKIVKSFGGSGQFLFGGQGTDCRAGREGDKWGRFFFCDATLVAFKSVSADLLIKSRSLRHISGGEVNGRERTKRKTSGFIHRFFWG